MWHLGDFLEHLHLFPRQDGNATVSVTQPPPPTITTIVTLPPAASTNPPPPPPPATTKAPDPPPPASNPPVSEPPKNTPAPSPPDTQPAKPSPSSDDKPPTSKDEPVTSSTSIPPVSLASISVVTSADDPALPTDESQDSSTTSTAKSPLYKGSGSLLLSTCATPTFSLIPGPSTVLYAPVIGCGGSRPECCPFSVARHTPATSAAFPAQKELSSCPDDYQRISNGCCPKSYFLWESALGNDKKTPCFSALSNPLTPPPITTTLSLTADADQATVTLGDTIPTSAIVNLVFAQHLAVSPAPSSPGGSGSSGWAALPRGAKFGVAIAAGIVIFSICAFGAWLLWKRNRRNRRDAAAWRHASMHIGGGGGGDGDWSSARGDSGGGADRNTVVVDEKMAVAVAAATAAAAPDQDPAGARPGSFYRPPRQSTMSMMSVSSAYGASAAPQQPQRPLSFVPAQGELLEVPGNAVGHSYGQGPPPQVAELGAPLPPPAAAAASKLYTGRESWPISALSVNSNGLPSSPESTQVAGGVYEASTSGVGGRQEMWDSSASLNAAGNVEGRQELQGSQAGPVRHEAPAGWV